ncbi:PD40 domain-containing protein [candidate division WOR-3 bacterium]|nr:PD40 domain-containing protein [candidate division WOR-3 bacterium]
MRRVILFAVMLGLFLPLWAQEIPLTSDSYNHRYAQWSPDGNWVVYCKWDATGHGQIYKVLSGGGAETPLTSDGYHHWSPQWSPDGNWIVYYKDDATTYYQIYKVSSTGGAETPLTSDSYDHRYPQWSPDGNWIVYEKLDATGYRQIYKVSSGAGIEETEIGNNQTGTISVYPNLLTGNTPVKLSLSKKGYVEVSVYGISGRLVYHNGPVQWSEGSHVLQLKNLQNGIYFLKVELDGVSIGEEKLIILR